MRELPQCAHFNRRTGDEGEEKAPIVHGNTSFLKGGFLTHVLPRALQLQATNWQSLYFIQKENKGKALAYHKTPGAYLSPTEWAKVPHRRKTSGDITLSVFSWMTLETTHWVRDVGFTEWVPCCTVHTLLSYPSLPRTTWLETNNCSGLWRRTHAALSQPLDTRAAHCSTFSKFSWPPSLD